MKLESLSGTSIDATTILKVATEREDGYDAQRKRVVYGIRV